MIREKKYLEDIVNAKARKIYLDENLDRFEDEKVAVEAPIRLFLNGKDLTTIMASPSNLKEMAVGFLIDEGVVPCRNDIVDISLEETKVSIKSKIIILERFKSINENGFIFTSCRSRANLNRAINEFTSNPITSDQSIEAEDVLMMVDETIKKSAVFKSTGAVHLAAVFVNKAMIGFAEDVGRHTAVDKAIGMALMKKNSLSGATLITSGRQPTDIVFKAARCKIPISISMKAPISSGVHAADIAGITLICFARNRRMNIYTHPERVNPLQNILKG